VTVPPVPLVSYDEFGLFHENADEHGLPFVGPPVVRRESVALPDGRHLSALVWGQSPPEVVFVHGGAQNAHTWDTTIMALGRPAIAIDLAGHGHSDWRPDGVYAPATFAADVAVAVRVLAPQAAFMVGMSMGGLTSMEFAANHGAQLAALMMVDITPGVNREKAAAVVAFVDGPQSFDSFDALLARTMQHNPTRSESSLRRGILHNARQLDDGTWVWRYDRGSHSRSTLPEQEPSDAMSSAMSPLWDDFASISCPMVLVRGSLSPVVDDDDVAEALRRQPGLRVEVVAGAGHSVQGDRPLELAALIASMLAG
jgi:pimeloyl-ACP methyl ester carboxylesterase